MVKKELKQQMNDKENENKNHTDYPETTKATDNSKRSCNQLAGIGCKYLSGNNLPRISLIRGKLFPDWIYPEL